MNKMTYIIIALVIIGIIVFLLTRQHKSLGLTWLTHTPKLAIVKRDVQAEAT